MKKEHKKGCVFKKYDWAVCNCHVKQPVPKNRPAFHVDSKLKKAAKLAAEAFEDEVSGKQGIDILYKDLALHFDVDIERKSRIMYPRTGECAHGKPLRKTSRDSQKCQFCKIRYEKKYKKYYLENMTEVEELSISEMKKRYPKKNN